VIIALKLKFLFGRSKKDDGRGEGEEKTLLFVCVENAGRAR
jgi:hypothetical protein